MHDEILSHNRWSADRVARLGFLMGQGWDAQRVARDPLIASNAANVRRQAYRFGLAFTGASQRLPPPVLDELDQAAARRRVSREGLMRSLLLAAGSQPALIDTLLNGRAR